MPKVTVFHSVEQANNRSDGGFSKQASVELEVKLGLMSNLANEEYFV